MSTSISHIRFFIIIISTLIIVSGCTSTRDSSNILSSAPSAVYFTTNEGDQYINDFEKTGALVVSSFDEVPIIFSEYPELQALYIGENNIHYLDKEWLQEMYREGVLIASINEPISVLADVLTIQANLPDIDFSLAPDGFIVMTAVKSFNEPTRGTEGYYVVSDYFANIEDAVQAISAVNTEGKDFYPPPSSLKEN